MPTLIENNRRFTAPRRYAAKLITIYSAIKDTQPYPMN